ncbi:FG-GAP repeat protein, partial [Flavobacteriales bacterium]|nr:FG-GAP repeat protein [Flavobacteriales bacterium]
DIDGEAANDKSGRSVSLSSDGNTVAIGAYGNSGNGTDAGHVRIYENTSGYWSQIGQDIDGEAAGDYSGYSVSLSSNGNIIAIGANGNDVNGTYAGHVRIYENTGGTWSQIGQDIDGEAAGDYSGYSVSLSSDGSTVAIGAPYNDGNGSNSGHVRIYENTSGSWLQIGQDIDGEAADDYSGYSVSFSSDGSTAAIGAPGNNEQSEVKDNLHKNG